MTSAPACVAAKPEPLAHWNVGGPPDVHENPEVVGRGKGISAACPTPPVPDVLPHAMSTKKLPAVVGVVKLAGAVVTLHDGDTHDPVLAAVPDAD